MANKVYKNDVGTVISLDAGESMAGASQVQILYRKPNRTTGAWTASVSGNYGQYTTQAGDLNVNGMWEVHLYVTDLSGWTGHGELAKFRVYDRWE